MRTPLIAANWKMNKTHLEAIVLVKQLAIELAQHSFERVEVALCPPFTTLRTLQLLMDSDHYRFELGAQNMHFEDAGAFTGEISGSMLKSLNVKYVILGHSERRELFGETDEAVNKKMHAAFRHGLVPIMCCGETDSERRQGATEEKVERQVREGLAGLEHEALRSTVIAYEPIWAIGTGKTATPDDAQATISYIRALLDEDFGDDIASRVRILYGGSVKAGNAAALTAHQDIDGALVGGASLDGPEFAAIVKATT